MEVLELPPEISVILTKVKAPPRLIAHLRLVHDVAVTLANQVETIWPNLHFDKQAVLIGAATHDIGKALFPEELSQSGKKHEEIGPELLIKYGLNEKYARFARSHARWQENNVGIEDLMVALADKIWKGQRNENLEMALCQMINDQFPEEIWQTYLKLDEISASIAKEADTRLAWQAEFPTL